MRVAPFAWVCSDGTQTASRVWCWQAKMPRPPTRTLGGQRNTLKRASVSLPSGSGTGRLKCTGPTASMPRSRSISAPAAASVVVKAARSRPSRFATKSRRAWLCGVGVTTPSSSR